MTWPRRSVLAHTVSGGTIARVRCNGVALGEIGLNSALGGYPLRSFNGRREVCPARAIDR